MKVTRIYTKFKLCESYIYIFFEILSFDKIYEDTQFCEQNNFFIHEDKNHIKVYDR